MIQNYFVNLSEIEEYINREYGVTQKQVNDMVDILKKWVEQQPHFPSEDEEVLNNKLKCILRYNKMSLERTKQKLDMYYAVRNYFPEFFNNNELFNTDMNIVYDASIIVPLKKAVNGARLIYAMITDPKPEAYEDSFYYRAVVNYMEIKCLFDVTSKDIGIFDLKNMSFGHVLRMSPMFMMKFNTLCEKAYCDRIAGVHFLNVPPYFKRIIDIMRSIFKKKVGNRIYLHENLNTLYEHIPKDVMPKEYGGNTDSIHELYVEWRKFLENNNDVFKQLRTKKSNEELRPGKPLQNNMFGIDGSFRKLDID